jgi:hypothetical protein
MLGVQQRILIQLQPQRAHSPFCRLMGRCEPWRCSCAGAPPGGGPCQAADAGCVSRQRLERLTWRGGSSQLGRASTTARDDSRTHTFMHPDGIGDIPASCAFSAWTFQPTYTSLREHGCQVWKAFDFRFARLCTAMHECELRSLSSFVLSAATLFGQHLVHTLLEFFIVIRPWTPWTPFMTRWPHKQCADCICMIG